MDSHLRTALQGQLSHQLRQSASAVEHDIAGLLAEGGLPDGASRQLRYQRKIDITHRIAAAYDGVVGRPLTEQSISGDGYLALALVFMRSAGEASQPAAARLRWINSAFNCLDQIDAQRRDDRVLDQYAALQALMRSAVT